MNGDDWRPLFSGLAVLISLTALALSILAFRRGLPKLRIEATTATVVDAPNGPQAMVIVKVVNDGGALAQISAVFLDAVDGSLREYPGELGERPRMPYKLAANGGLAVWRFDYAQLRQRERGQVRDRPLRVRATVQVGSHLHRQKGQIRVAPLGSTTHPRSRRERTVAWFRSWAHPGVALYPFATASDFDLVKGTGPLTLINAGRGVTRPYKLTLTVQHTDGLRDRVPGLDPVQIHRIWPGRQITLRVPLVNAPSSVEGDSFWWSTTSGRGIGCGYGAHTRADAEDLVRRLREQDPSTAMRYPPRP